MGATLTTRHTIYGNEVDAIFELPEGVDSYAIVPIGHPIGNFGPVRRSKDGLVHNDRWDNPR